MKERTRAVVKTIEAAGYAVGTGRHEDGVYCVRARDEHGEVWEVRSRDELEAAVQLMMDLSFTDLD